MPSFLQSCGMLASQVASGISLKPTLPTDNNVLLSITVSQSGAQSPLGCLRVVYLGPCCLSSILMICPLCPLFQHLFYLQTILNVVPEFCHYLTPHVFKMTWTWCTTGVPIAGSHLTPPNAACFDSTIGVYHRLMPPIILANQKFLILTTVKILVLYFLQTFPGCSIITTFQLRPPNNSDWSVGRFPLQSQWGLRNLLYLSLVRSQLTYCCQIWRPHLIKDIIFIEII